MRNKKKEEEVLIKEGMTNQEEVLFLGNRIKELEEKNIRFQAELANYKRRKDDEYSRMVKYANEDVIYDFLTILDNFERAINIKSTEENTKYVEGINMIYSQIISWLSKYDLTEIESFDKPFDPTFHQAVMTECDKLKDEDIVLEVLQKGYMYKDKVIRPAMVKVNKKGEMTNE